MVEQYQKLIHSVVYKVAGHKMDRADLEDIVSAVNLRLLEEGGSRSIGSFDPARGMELTTFVGMVAKSAAVDALRRLKEEVPIQEEPGDDAGEYYTPVSAETDALAALVRKEQVSRVRQAISMLSEEDQHFLEVLMSDTGSLEDYAAKLGVTVGNLKVRKHRIIARLKKILGNLYRSGS